jgi:excisionase family DNA binding protein
MNGEERYLKVDEVASLFRVEKTTVRRWIQAGRLISYPTPGRQHRFKESEVRALLMQPADDTAEEGS